MTEGLPLYLQEKVIPARRDRQFISALYDDIEQVLSGLAVTAAGGYDTSIASGYAMVQGDDAAGQGMYEVYNDASVQKTHTPVPTLPKVDRVVFRVYDSIEVGSGSDAGVIEIVPGTPTAGATLVNNNGIAALPASAIPLARILVPITGGSITSAEIADDRPRTSGRSIIATEESRTNTAYGLLTTPDIVRNVVLPTDGLIVVAYQVLAKQSVTTSGRAAIFLGANQIKGAAATNGPPLVQEAAWQDTFFSTLATYSGGLDATDHTNDSSHVTTGQIVGSDSDHRGVCCIFAAPGTYDISVQYKALSGSVTAKERKLWVESRKYMV